MKIRFITSIFGQGWAHSFGDVIDTKDATATRLIEAGVAELVPVETEVETATAPDAVIEQAVVKMPAKRKSAIVKKVVPA